MGLHIFLIVALWTLAFFAPVCRAQTAVTTAHYDNYRTGANTAETVLTPNNVTTEQFGKLARLPVSGCIFAQPLYVPSVTTPDRGTRNLVFISTSNNNVYAYDADDYALQWIVNLGTPFPSSAIAQYYDFLDCSPGDTPSPAGIGIVGTPVIDARAGAMYLVTNTTDDATADAPTAHHVLHKIRLSDGAEMLPPVEIEGSYQGVAFQARYQLQRPALLLLNDRVYIAFASHHDETPYYGWMFSYNSSLQQVGIMNYAPTKSGAGIWQSGGGPASDGKYIYFNTGNNTEGEADATDNSESILKVDPVTLGVISKTSFFPEEDTWDDDSDLDLGSSRVILIPHTSHLISGSKLGDIFYVHTADMTLGARRQAAARHSSGLDWTGVYNGFAYWNNTIFVWPGGGAYWYGNDPGFPTDTLKAFVVAGDGRSLHRIANGQSDNLGVGYQGAGITISANGSNPSTGIVWAYTPAQNTLGIQPGYLHAYQAFGFSNGVFHELWNNVYDRFGGDSGCSFAKFTQPLVANGKVFLPTASQRVLVYGLLSEQPPAALAADFAADQNCSPTPKLFGN